MTGRRAFPVLIAIGLIVIFATAGCSSAPFSGLDATNKFPCAAPDGVSCMSMSGVYANAQVGNLPGMRTDYTKPQYKPGSGPDPDPGNAPATPGATVRPTSASPPAVEFTTPGQLPTAFAAAPQNQLRASPGVMNAPTTGTPIRSPERILRVWIRPYEDSDGDLHDQRYVYVTVNRGVWAIDAANDAIKSQYRTIRLLSKPEPAGQQEGAGQDQTRVAPTSATPAGPVSLSRSAAMQQQ